MEIGHGFSDIQSFFVPETSMTAATSCMAGSRCFFVILENKISCKPYAIPEISSFPYHFTVADVYIMKNSMVVEGGWMIRKIGKWRCRKEKRKKGDGKKDKIASQ